jgi:hypothetical protein
MFSFSCSGFFMASAAGTPSMNWKAFNFVLACVDGMIGGPVTTCLGGGASGPLWWD